MTNLNSSVVSCSSFSHSYQLIASEFEAETNEYFLKYSYDANEQTPQSPSCLKICLALNCYSKCCCEHCLSLSVCCSEQGLTNYSCFYSLISYAAIYLYSYCLNYFAASYDYECLALLFFFWILTNWSQGNRTPNCDSCSIFHDFRYSDPTAASIIA